MVAHPHSPASTYASERLTELARKAKGRPVRIGIISMYDVENNAVRILAGIRFPSAKVLKLSASRPPFSSNEG